MTISLTPEATMPEPVAPERAEIDDKVRHIIAESLGRDLRLVTLEASLTDERAYDVQITRGEMERAARGDMTEEAFAPGGEISPAGLERLRTLMPEASARITPGLRTVQIMSLFTARTFASIVQAKRQQAQR